MKRSFALALALALCLTSCQKAGEFQVYEGEVLSKDAPAGGNTLYLQLKNDWTVYTTDDTRDLNADGMTCGLPLWTAYQVGDRIKVWADAETKDGRSKAYCILRNIDQGLDQGHTGGFYKVAQVTDGGESLVFTDTDQSVTVTVDKADVAGDPESLAEGATCFVWYAKEDAPPEIAARSVSVVTEAE